MAEIKISELSIGDWARVNGVTTKVWYLSEDGEVNDTTYDWVEPIPLTAEILEKNGFRKNGEYNEWNIGTWETPYLLGVSLERPAITIKWNGSSIFIDQARYVHQLQHALRLAGVVKEIEV